MMSSVECFAQAEKLDETARNFIEGSAKSALVAAAKEWRQLAMAAQAQEAWEVLLEDVLEKPSGA